MFQARSRGVAKSRGLRGSCRFVGLLLGFVSFNVDLKIEKHKNPHHSRKTHKLTFPDLDERSRISCNCGFVGLRCWIAFFWRQYDLAPFCLSLTETLAAIMIQPVRDITSQSCPSPEGNELSHSIFTPWNRPKFEKITFYAWKYLNPKLYSPLHFLSFQAKNSYLQFFKKQLQQLPWWIDFPKILPKLMAEEPLSLVGYRVKTWKTRLPLGYFTI